MQHAWSPVAGARRFALTLTVLPLAVALALLPGARAEGEGPLLLTLDDAEIIALPGAHLEIHLAAKNPSGSPQAFRVLAKGPLFEWGAFMPADRLLLAPGESTVQPLFARVPPGLPPGDYRFEFALHGPTGTSDPVTLLVRVATSFVGITDAPIAVALASGADLLAVRGATHEVPLLVTNFGTSDLDVDLGATAPEGWSAVPVPSLVTVRAGSSVDASALLTVPDDPVGGAGTISVTAVAGGISETLEFTVHSQPPSAVVLPPLDLAPAARSAEAPAGAPASPRPVPLAPLGVPVAADPRRGGPSRDGALQGPSDASIGAPLPLPGPVASPGIPPTPPAPSPSTVGEPAAAPPPLAFEPGVAAPAVALAAGAATGFAAGPWIGLALGLYSRLSRPQVARHPQRARILARIADAPGIHFSQLLRDLSLATGVLDHHLATLERSGLVVSRFEGARRRLFLSGYAPPPPTAAEPIPLRERLLGLLRAGRAASPTDMARSLEVSRQAATYHLKALAKEGVVAERPARGRTVVFEIVAKGPPARVRAEASAG